MTGALEFHDFGRGLRRGVVRSLRRGHALGDAVPKSCGPFETFLSSE
jgi:hypothetical protein